MDLTNKLTVPSLKGKPRRLVQPTAHFEAEAEETMVVIVVVAVVAVMVVIKVEVAVEAEAAEIKAIITPSNIALTLPSSKGTLPLSTETLGYLQQQTLVTQDGSLRNQMSTYLTTHPTLPSTMHQSLMPP